MSAGSLSESLLALSPDEPLTCDDAAALCRKALPHLFSRRDWRPFALENGLAKGLIWESDEVARRGVAVPRDGLEPGLPVVCAIGAFDGVHLGHRALFERARLEAKRRGAHLVAVSFSPDPAYVLGAPPAGLDLLDEEGFVRDAAICGAGCDALVDLEFTLELSRVPYDRFVRDVLGALFDVRCIVVGADFRLGAMGRGDVAALTELGKTCGFDVVGEPLLELDGGPVTATRIRGLVHEGRVEAAATLLGRCHFASGEVAHGRGEGSTFGFPTANVLVKPNVCLPDQGVYAGFAVRREEAGVVAYPCAVNVGRPPTFDEGEPRDARALLEANLIGFTGDLYGTPLTLVFVRWLRDSRPFASLEELKRTVLGNVSWTRDTFGNKGLVLAEGGDAS